MRSPAFAFALLLALSPIASRAADDFPLGPDSKPQASVPKGELIKGQYTAKEGSVFPGTEREYTIYLPAGLDKSKPAPFMVFQDGVIYQAPTVFDNLIAKKEIPPLIGIFIKPGIVPAANPNALPRFNRSYEYDSVTDTYSRFLIDEFLPAVTQKHGLNLSQKGDDAAISGNSSGGICAFMVAWHRPDRFRRVFTGVGTYVGIHGADQLPVLVRKMEPKPLRVYLQSGTNDNNLYCGDWWMANQTMERSLTWAGYDVNHTWGEGGHNAKHASQIFPDVLRWLWRGYPEEGLRANPSNTSKWLGYGVLGQGRWECVLTAKESWPSAGFHSITSDMSGSVFVGNRSLGEIYRIELNGNSKLFAEGLKSVLSLTVDTHGRLLACANEFEGGNYFATISPDGKILSRVNTATNAVATSHDGKVLVGNNDEIMSLGLDGKLQQAMYDPKPPDRADPANPFPSAQNQMSPSVAAFGYITKPRALVFSPDQTLLYMSGGFQLGVACLQVRPDGLLSYCQRFHCLESWSDSEVSFWEGGLCVDTEGRLYVATALGIQVCDQAGRVNFIISTPEQPHDVCFGGKDLSELFIACGDKIYKHPTQVHGIVTGQMPPIKPAPPKL